MFDDTPVSTIAVTAVSLSDSTNGTAPVLLPASTNPGFIAPKTGDPAGATKFAFVLLGPMLTGFANPATLKI